MTFNRRAAYSRQQYLTPLGERCWKFVPGGSRVCRRPWKFRHNPVLFMDTQRKRWT